MDAGVEPDAALISWLAFWADAGVDGGFEDAPVDRLQPPPAPAAPPPPASHAPAPPPRAGPSRADLTDEVRRAQAAAAAAGSWEALVTAIHGFQTPLRPKGARTLIARGALQGPRLLAIGEADTAEDEAAGEPFSARLGGLLDRMLAAIGVREQTLVMPTAFWRARDRARASALEVVCAPFLARAAALTRPDAALLLGEAALRAVLERTEPILQARGRWADWSVEGRALPALPVFHPAFLLQHPAAKKRTWGDLLVLQARLENQSGAERA